jgi:ribose transport system ATP-binding protein
MSQQPLVTLQNVGKTFGPVTVIKDVTVSVYAGQVQVLLGENGAGKSTLIKMMARRIRVRRMHRRPGPRTTPG